MIASGNWAGWVEVLFFGAGLTVFCVLLLPGSSYLKLDSAGFTFCSLFKPHTLRWNEVGPFGAATVGLRTLVGFNFSPPRQGQVGMRNLAIAVAGYEAALPDTYGMKPETLAALMNEWRQRSIGSSIVNPSA
jgi:hypothetical protein